MPESIAKTVGGKIFTFGSFRLGVHTKGKTLTSVNEGPYLWFFLSIIGIVTKICF